MRSALGAYLLLTAALTACAHPRPADSRANPAPAMTALYKDYPISAAFERTGPTLTPQQRRWIRRVLASKNYGPLHARLRFADAADMTVPLVVYVEPTSTPPPSRKKTIAVHIIGDACNAYFSSTMGIFAAPGDAACGTNTPKPLR